MTDLLGVFGFPPDLVIFFLILSLVASTVNGGLRYGYSSISIPLAILFLGSKIVNPAYVLLELILNGAMLIYGRKYIRSTFRRALPVMMALAPGVALGSIVLNIVSPTWTRLLVYVLLLPLILVQAAGYRRPIRSELAASVPFGTSLGLVYSLTTISGPPLALFWNNQGLAKGEFRAALAQVRVAEGLLTSSAYYVLNLYTPTSSPQEMKYVNPHPGRHANRA